MKPTDSFLSYGRQTIEDDDLAALVNAARSPFLTQGPAVAELEKAICERFGVKHACVMNSATAALHVAALSLGWGKGDWILTTPITFLASANCALYVGADVDFVDIDPETYTMSPAALERKLVEMKKAGKKVKAVVAVDYAGHPCDWPAIQAIARREGLQLIDDACHAPGAKFYGKELCAAEGVAAAALEAAAAQRKKVNDDENTGIAQLEKDGMTVVRKVDGLAFRDALKDVYASYSKEFGADNIRRIQDFK